MAPKLTVDESLRFLYLCFKNKTNDNVDFKAVSAEIGNLKPEAARMRFYRLRDAIENHKEGNNGEGGKGEAGSVSPGKAKENGKEEDKGKGKGGARAGAGAGKGKKRKLNEVENAAEDVAEGVKVKDEE